MKKKFIENLLVYDITNDLSAYKPDHLVAFAVDTLLKNGIEPSFQYIVATCHKLFPGVFSLGVDFPEFPDSLKVKEALNSLEPCLSDTNLGIYRLNNEGKQISRDVSGALMKVIKIQAPKTAKLNISNSTSRNYTSLQLAKAYSQYLTDRILDLNLLWEYLGANLNSDRKTLQKFFQEINSYASMIGDKSIAQFTKEVIDAIR